MCKKAKLKMVPCGHVYAKGELVRRSALGKKSWDDFKEAIDELRAELA